MKRLVAPLCVLAALTAVGCGGDAEDGPAAPMRSPDVALGCDEGVGELRANPSVAGAGDIVGLEVENLSEDRVLTYGLASELERAEGGEWAPVELPPTPILELALVVEPGETSAGGGGATQDRLELPKDLEPGDYRVVKTVNAGDPRGGGATEALELCAALTVEG